MAETSILHASALFRVVDSRCRARRSGPSATRGAEPTHLACSGGARSRTTSGRGSYVGDPCTALLHHSGLDYRISHPGDGGDDATLIAAAGGDRLDLDERVLLLLAALRMDQPPRQTVRGSPAMRRRVLARAPLAARSQSRPR